MMTTENMTNITNWSALDASLWETLVQRARHHYNQAQQPNGAQWTTGAQGKSMALLFFNPSLRTRTSMELAAEQLGAHTTTLVSGEGTWGFAWDDGGVMDGTEAEHIREAVGVLSRYYDALGVRVFASGDDYEADRQDILLKKFVDAADVPVVNLESAFYHPCQALADAATIRETSQPADDTSHNKRLVLTWTYHPKALPMAVPNSALQMAAREGMDITLAAPPSHSLDSNLVAEARFEAESQGGSLEESSDMDAAFAGADVVYAKSWGGPLMYRDPEEEIRQRKAHQDWRVTSARMQQTDKAAFMHCLPVRRNVVVDDAVIDGANAIHLTQAEMRLHAQKAILEHIWNLN